jgi:hypothetical protein
VAIANYLASESAISMLLDAKFAVEGTFQMQVNQ